MPVPKDPIKYEEFCRKASERMKGKRNPMYGKTHSEEVKQGLRELHLGKPLSEEHKKKISEKVKGKNNPMYGKQFSEEIRQKMREAKLRIRDQLSKRMSGKGNPMYGKKFSEEHRRKICEKSKGNKHNLGRKHSEEWKEENSRRMKGKTPWNKDKESSFYWCHEKAWKLFGKENCEKCGMSLFEHEKKYDCRFPMHCTGSPKDYTLMEESNWMTLCHSCHSILEEQLKKESSHNNHMTTENSK